MVKLHPFPKDFGVLIFNALMVVLPSFGKMTSSKTNSEFHLLPFDVCFLLLAAVEIFLVGLGTWHLCCGAEPLPCTMWPGLQAGVDDTNNLGWQFCKEGWNLCVLKTYLVVL